MKYLNLDPNFKPFEGEEIQFETMTFSGGEPHIKILSELSVNDSVGITTRLTSFDDLGVLLLATDAIKRFYIEDIHCTIPYFPAARQDRIMVPGEALSVKVYADIINAQMYTTVTVFDAHSEVTPALLDNVYAVPNHHFVKECLKNMKDLVLVSPDGGALKKIYKLSKYLGGVPVVECSKKRDVATGKLSGFKVYADSLEGKNCVVIDDICDGGGTFLGLADKLKEKGAENLSLIVSHGIFKRGTESILEKYNEIYTSNSFKDHETTFNFHQINLNRDLLKL